MMTENLNGFILIDEKGKRLEDKMHNKLRNETVSSISTQRASQVVIEPTKHKFTSQLTSGNNTTYEHA